MNVIFTSVQFILLNQSLALLIYFLFSECFSLLSIVWLLAAAAVVVIKSFTSSYAYVNTEQHKTPINCSIKSSNRKSSEQTTIDGLILDFLDFLPRNLLRTNNISSDQFSYTDETETPRNENSANDAKTKFNQIFINLKLNFSNISLSKMVCLLHCGPIQ